MDCWVRGPARRLDQSIFELDHGHRLLPDGLEGSGVYVQGHNSDDLFMFLKKQVGGLRPN